MSACSLLRPPQRQLLLLLAAVTAVAVFQTPAAQAEALSGKSSKSPRVVIVVTDGIGLADLVDERHTNISSVIKEGAVGLMNPRTAGIGATSAYLTLGAGERAVAPPQLRLAPRGGLAFNADELTNEQTAGRLFQARTGRDARLGSVVHLFASELAQMNATGERGAIPGLLGQQLAQKDLTVAVIGNADSFEVRRRPAALLGMDTYGLVPQGDVGRSTWSTNRSMPGERITDFARLTSTFNRMLPISDLVVIETGDTHRINAEVNSIDPGLVLSARKKAMSRVDLFIGNIRRSLDPERDTLLLVTPSAPAELEAWQRMVPVVMWGRGASPGILTSPSTRRTGIVTNMDLAPTVLSLLGVDVPADMSGRAFNGVDHEAPVAYLTSRQQEILNVEQIRKPVLNGFIVLAVGSLLAGLSFVFLGLRGRVNQLLRYLLLWVLAAPLSMLVFSAFGQLDPVLLAALIAGGALTIALLAELSSALHRTYPLLIIGGLTTLALIIDIFTGAQLGAQSPLGYSMVQGSRFYGIGNEYMGVLLGTAVIVTGIVADRFGRGPVQSALMLLVLLISLLVMAMPFWGANVGGTIALAAGFTTLALLVTRGRLSWKEWMVMLAIVVGSVLVLLAVDSFSTSQSHAAKAAGSVASGGPEAIAKIIGRKVSMNYKLLRATAWSQILGVTAIMLIALLYRPDLVRRFRDEHPYLSTSYVALGIGALFAFAFNDSGVIAAACTLLLGAAAFLYLLLRSLASSPRSA